MNTIVILNHRYGFVMVTSIVLPMLLLEEARRCLNSIDSFAGKLLLLFSEAAIISLY